MTKHQGDSVDPKRLAVMIAVLVIWALDILSAIISTFIAQLTDHGDVIWRIHWEVGAVCAGMLLAVNWWKAPMFGVKWFKGNGE